MVVIYAKLVLEGISNVTSISSSVYHFIFEIHIRIRHYLSAPLFQKFFITSLDGKMSSQIINQDWSTLLGVSSSRIQTSVFQSRSKRTSLFYFLVGGNWMCNKELSETIARRTLGRELIDINKEKFI